MLKIDTGYRVSANQAMSLTASKKTDSDFAKVLHSQAKPSMDDIFKNASATYQVPEKLLKAVAKAESNFNPEAVSHCGASGVMQLMPKTAQSLGVTDVFDAEQNIMGGAKYLKQMLDRYNGDVKLALAAYNAGSGNVDKYGGIPAFKETQDYVKKVMKYAGEELKIEVQPGTNTQSKTKVEPASFQNIYEEIINFDDYTEEDYRVFAEYLKLSLLSPIDSDYSRNRILSKMEAFYL